MYRSISLCSVGLRSNNWLVLFLLLNKTMLIHVKDVTWKDFCRVRNGTKRVDLLFLVSSSERPKLKSLPIPKCRQFRDKLLSFILLSFQTKDVLWQRLSQSKFSSFAILCKRVTSLYSTKERICFAFKVFQNALSKQVRLDLFYCSNLS